jgi:hypothetical protein
MHDACYCCQIQSPIDEPSKEQLLKGIALGKRRDSPRVVETDVKNHRRGVEYREYMTAWNAEVRPHHTITQNVTALQDNDIVTYAAVVSTDLV